MRSDNGVDLSVLLTLGVIGMLLLFIYLVYLWTDGSVDE
jgi:hypothetical protein